MKKILVLLSYCIPFSFFAMFGDVTFDTMWLYIFAILGYGFMCWFGIRYLSIVNLLLGNALSCVISVIFVELFQTEEWSWYFKPFKAETLVVIISVVALAVQLIVWFFKRKKLDEMEKE